MTIELIQNIELPNLVAPHFEFTVTISKPFGALEEIIIWCKSEVTGDWRWQLLETSTDNRPGEYKFYFEQEKDCCAFSLKWA